MNSDLLFSVESLLSFEPTREGDSQSELILAVVLAATNPAGCVVCFYNYIRYRTIVHAKGPHRGLQACLHHLSCFAFLLSVVILISSERNNVGSFRVIEETLQPQAALDAVADGFTCNGSCLRIRARVALANVSSAEHCAVAHFATKYVAEHRQDIANPADFEVTDEIFNEFKAFINPEKFEYDKVCEQQLATLRKTATTEGYMNDSTAAQFDRLEAMLKHDLDHDLDLHRRDISYLIGQEIMDRLYFQRGQVQHSIKDDEYLDKAQKMFNTAGEYARILNLSSKKKGKTGNKKK